MQMVEREERRNLDLKAGRLDAVPRRGLLGVEAGVGTATRRPKSRRRSRQQQEQEKEGVIAWGLKSTQRGGQRK